MSRPTNKKLIWSLINNEVMCLNMAVVLTSTLSTIITDALIIDDLLVINYVRIYSESQNVIWYIRSLFYNNLDN